MTVRNLREEFDFCDIFLPKKRDGSAMSAGLWAGTGMSQHPETRAGSLSSPELAWGMAELAGIRHFQAVASGTGIVTAAG